MQSADLNLLIWHYLIFNFSLTLPYLILKMYILICPCHFTVFIISGFYTMLIVFMFSFSLSSKSHDICLSCNYRNVSTNIFISNTNEDTNLFKINNYETLKSFRFLERFWFCVIDKTEENHEKSTSWEKVKLLWGV